MSVDLPRPDSPELFSRPSSRSEQQRRCVKRKGRRNENALVWYPRTENSEKELASSILPNRSTPEPSQFRRTDNHEVEKETALERAAVHLVGQVGEADGAHELLLDDGDDGLVDHLFLCAEAVID